MTFLALIGFVGVNWSPATETVAAVAPPPAGGQCTPPDWAVATGHVEMWKLHNHCK